MALTEAHWKLLCAVSALTPTAAGLAYLTSQDEPPACRIVTAADSGPQPGFSMLAERTGPACTRVELPPLSN